MNFFRILLFVPLFSFSQLQWAPLAGISDNINGQRYDDVFFLNDDLGWAANGFYASVHKTTDGGETWTEQLNEDDLTGDFYFRNIEFLNENIGFIGTLNGTFFKTINGGDDWTEESITPNPVAICGIDAIGASTVYGCGAFFGPAFIIKSTDSGDTWQYIDMSAYAEALVEILFTDENTGYAAGRNANGATLLKTTNGGGSWTEIYNSGQQGEFVWKFQILDSDPDHMFGAIEASATNMGKVIVSSNGGDTWQSYDAPETHIQAVGFISPTQGWMGGHTTGFYETTDGGQTWTNLNIGSNLNRIFVIRNDLAYASGTGIYKFTNATLSTDSFAESSRVPLPVSVASNPIGNELKITIDYPKSDNMVIELYDASGRFLKHLARDINTPQGIKEYSFAFPWSSGIYLIDLHSNTGRQTLKVVKQ